MDYEKDLINYFSNDKKIELEFDLKCLLSIKDWELLNNSHKKVNKFNLVYEEFLNKWSSYDNDPPKDKETSEPA
jgi:hypothetical protein